MGDVEMGWEGSWLPHPEEQLFLDRLYLFMERRGSPISKVPNLGFKKIDLFLLYSAVKKLGGYEVVTSQRLWKTVYNELGASPGSTSAATCTRRHYEKLLLPYEQHVKGGNQELSNPKPTSTTAVSIKKPVRGKGGQTTPKKNGVTSQAAPPDGVVARKRGRPPGKRSTKVLSRSRVGRPPLIAKPRGEQVAVKDALNLPVFQEFRVSQALASTTFLPIQPKLDKDMKIEHESSAPSSLSGQSKLPIGGSLEGFSPTKGMCPLDLFRARLGLSGMSNLERVPQDPSIPHQTTLLIQTKTNSPQMLKNFQHQCSGCGLDNPSWTGGSRDGRTTRPPLPPLKILPLDIDCSLQLRQLMRTRLGSAHMNSFTKRLSEALAQDLSKTSQPDRHVLPICQEQAAPLNLSKKATTKRSSDDLEVRDSELQDYDESQAKKLKKEPEDLCLKPIGSLSEVAVVQDEPADLSSPRRVRALFQGRTSIDLTGAEATCISPNANHDASSNSAFPCSVLLSSVTAPKEDIESIPVDLKLGKAAIWKTEPEITLMYQKPEPTVEHVSQLMPYNDSTILDYDVPSLKQLPTSHLSKPPQSC